MSGTGSKTIRWGCVGGTLVLLALSACDGSESKLIREEGNHTAEKPSPFAHLKPQPPGGKWLAAARNRLNLVREFPKPGTVFLVGVSLARLIAVAYDVHPRDVVFEPLPISFLPRPPLSARDVRNDVPFYDGHDNRHEYQYDDPLYDQYYDAVVHPRDGRVETAHRMLRDLIGEHLGLRVGRERSEAMSMVLGPAPGSPPLQPSDSRKRSLELREGELRAIGSPISQLIWLLREDSKLPVLDETQLFEYYDYLLEWDPKKGAYAFIQSLGDVGLSLSPAVREVERLVVTKSASPAVPGEEALVTGELRDVD